MDRLAATVRAAEASATTIVSTPQFSTSAFNRADFKRALVHWDRAAQVGPADHPLAVAARSGAADARQRLQAEGDKPLPQPTPPAR